MAGMYDEAMEDLDEDSAAAPEASGEMDSGRISEALREIADKVAMLQQALPAAKAVAADEIVDAATDEQESAEDPGRDSEVSADEGKSLAKSRAAAMIAKQLG